ncbi:HIT family protein [Salipaludibacillus agaradhaerens]|uniref:HIT family protein n=1 Tax=Salipaludibacillus agaradhaerens TaxID=76935 RepID=A0A9Q4B299_SALAG|nr:HIT family protein [Salipaludibacillus agaradhaerens]MCR6097012.1 HIT family protein [Salipaludibacillus agaradhaerens]MCR6113503.1 HIT family protein [Salipaludibacillus agaradhaerens]
MHKKEDCIFCKIVSGDIPSKKVYEDDHVLAFLDISQVTKGHTLVIPKTHEENIYELSSASAEHVFKAAPKVARAIKNAFLPEGINLLNNNGELAGQSVFHFHVHLLPRYGKGDGFGAVWHDHSSQYSNEDLINIAEKVQEKLY